MREFLKKFPNYYFAFSDILSIQPTYATIAVGDRGKAGFLDPFKAWRC